MTTDFLSVKEQLEIRRELKLEAERERIAAHSAHKQADEAARDLSARCAYDGTPANQHTKTLEVAQSWAGSATDGRVTIARCTACTSAERTYWEMKNRLQMVLFAAMERAGVEELWEDRAGYEISGLSWAGMAYRSRLNGGEDPGDETRPFSHLDGLTPETIDLVP